jgi:hypothetical protein
LVSRTSDLSHYCQRFQCCLLFQSRHAIVSSFFVHPNVQLQLDVIMPSHELNGFDHIKYLWTQFMLNNAEDAGENPVALQPVPPPLYNAVAAQ